MNLLACCSLALAFYACGGDDTNDDDDDTGGGAGMSSGGDGGTPADAGSGGQVEVTAGSGGAAGSEAGTGGMPEAGAGGTAGAAGSAGAGGVAGSGAGSGGMGGTGGTGGAGEFSCDDLQALAGAGGVSGRTCFDFTDPTSDEDWTPEGGSWVAQNGAYIGTAPATAPTCTGSEDSPMVASLVNDFSASDVRMRVKMTGISRADKVLVLRVSEDYRSRIEINFRANFGSNGGDVVVQESVDCVSAAQGLVPEGDVLHPHAATDTLDVQVELIGTHLKISIDGESKYDEDVPGLAATGPGGVGFAVIRPNGQTRFDDFVVESLDE